MHNEHGNIKTEMTCWNAWKKVFNRLLMLACSVILLQPSSAVQAQDPHFSQYYAAPLYLNPALAGVEKDMAFSLNHRTQWKSLGFAQNTSQFSFLAPVTNKNPRRLPPCSFGFSAYTDVAGENGSFSVMGANLAFAYNLPFNKQASQMISLGVQAGMIQKQMDGSQLQWGSQFDPSMGYNPDISPNARLAYYRATFPVIQAGGVWYFNPGKNRYLSDFSAFMGVSAANLNQPNESVLTNSPSPLPILLKLHGGADWMISPKVSIAPSYLLMQQNEQTQVNLGTYFTYHLIEKTHRGAIAEQASQAKALRLSLGGWYRLGDSFIIGLGLSQQRFSLGFSYDLNVSTLRQYTGGQGAYEISLSYKIVKNTTIKRFSLPMM
jgi:type IX secretion system PorP/SprF family membrane protein